MIIGINGKIGSGKDTIGAIIQKLCITNNCDQFENKKFAGKLKEIASILTGIPSIRFEDQDFKKTLLGSEWGTVKKNPLNAITPFSDINFNNLMSVRELLQKLGTEAMRDGLHTNVWVNALFANYSNKSNWVITDMRFPNELKAIEDKDGITIRVVRPKPQEMFLMNSTTVIDTRIPEHPSEIALDDAKFDYEIINDGTLEELVKKVSDVLINEDLL